VVLLILASGAIAAQAVGRQIRLDRLKNVFIATVTHELKTPLSSMRVLVDTLLEGNYEGEQTVNEYLRLISRENERLSHLIDNFLTFSRMERNKQAFEISVVSPVEIANAAAEAVRAKFDMNNVRFNVTMDKPLPMVQGDKDAMVTVLVNLLDNSYKYSGNDKDIEMRVYSGNGSVCFSVKDNGIGMTRRQAKKAFDRFYQADTSLARRTEGAGLGLSIVKFIVDAHNGRIDVKSEPGKGSVFTVKLPVERTAE
jgi:signal transduction histidine kinase